MQQLHRSELLSSLLIGAALLINGGCNKSSSSRSEQKELRSLEKLEEKNDIQVEEVLDIDLNETYLAVLHPLNTDVTSKVSGAVTISKEEDFMVADVRVNGSAPDTIHAQNVHIGSRCPTLEDDRNNDGFIDVLEAQRVTGSIIIPLDGDLNYQMSLSGVYPVSDPWGSYVYVETASYNHFLSDLISPDENPSDNIIKLQEEPNLEDKAVLIHGIAEDIILPSTVATNSILPNNQTLPIACGIFIKVTKAPGTFEEDDRTIGTVPTEAPQPSPERVRVDSPSNPSSDSEVPSSTSGQTSANPAGSNDPSSSPATNGRNFNTSRSSGTNSTVRYERRRPQNERRRPVNVRRNTVNPPPKTTDDDRRQ